jgi:hypothetical protein
MLISLNVDRFVDVQTLDSLEIAVMAGDHTYTVLKGSGE